MNDDLYKALAAFLICFGQGLPKELKESINQRVMLMADEIERGGEPNVARLTRGLGDSLLLSSIH